MQRLVFSAVIAASLAAVACSSSGSSGGGLAGSGAAGSAGFSGDSGGAAGTSAGGGAGAGDAAAEADAEVCADAAYQQLFDECTAYRTAESHAEPRAGEITAVAQRSALGAPWQPTPGVWDLPFPAFGIDPTNPTQSQVTVWVRIGAVQGERLSIANFMQVTGLELRAYADGSSSPLEVSELDSPTPFAYPCTQLDSDHALIAPSSSVDVELTITQKLSPGAAIANRLWVIASGRACDAP